MAYKDFYRRIKRFDAFNAALDMVSDNYGTCYMEEHNGLGHKTFILDVKAGSMRMELGI